MAGSSMDIRDYGRAIAEAAPELTPEQVDQLRRVIRQYARKENGRCPTPTVQEGRHADAPASLSG